MGECMKEQLTLGKFIKKLEAFIELNEESDGRILFDFGGFMPSGLDSYRGYYDQLSFEYKKSKFDKNDMTPLKLLDICKKAVGKKFTGYKGGDFFMDNDTPLWVDNYSECTSTAVVGVRKSWFGLVIETDNKD